ncbi:MAG: glycerate kinase [Pseudomonadota bacterium]|nr:glycerate kinase [Burkholderiaceae bacterium]MDQ3446440.1 glycerate kinase [Pseudomonadota bacterium]
MRASFDAAVAAADPLRVVAAHLPQPPTGRVIVVGAGKAAASMALAVERAWPDVALEGLVITRYAHGAPTQRIRVVEAGHPVPDEAGEVAARDIMRIVSQLQRDELLLVLLSGGGSSLLSLPVTDVPMSALKAMTAALLASGAPIGEMNVVRKHLSQIQGGRLAAAAAARGAHVLALIISDVTGDAPTDIASGPCAPDPSTYAEALGVFSRWEVAAPDDVSAWLRRGASGDANETPKPGDPLFERVENRVIATAHRSLEAAAEVFRAAGITPVLLGDTVTGEAREVARVYAAVVREIRAYNQPFTRPVALISGGECTVTLSERKNGRGGRCTEFLLSLASELGRVPDVYALACDTDGIDGSEDNAGAWLASNLVEEAAASARAALDRHDSYGFFSAIGHLIVTGPTRTNVNDYRVILIP